MLVLQPQASDTTAQLLELIPEDLSITTSCLETDLTDPNETDLTDPAINVLTAELIRLDLNAPQKLWLVGGREMWEPEREAEVVMAVEASTSLWQLILSKVLRLRYSPELIKL